MKLPMLHGVSNAQFDADTQRLLVRGWFLPRNAYDILEVVGFDGTVLGVAETGFPRPDLLKKYPEYEEANAGWQFCCAFNSFPNDLTIKLRFLKEGVQVITLDKLCESFTAQIADAIQGLKKDFVVLQNTGASIDYAKIRKDFESAGFSVREFQVNERDYQEWLSRIDYHTNYPQYCKVFGSAFSQKNLQHYLSLELLQINASNVLMDVASSISVFPDIAKKYSGIKRVWRQDMEYPKGIHGDKIGSFASAIPLDDCSVDAITLHCSLEHFEGEEDVRFFREGLRLLKPGGRICIIPLYVANELSIITSPSVWADKYKAYAECPQFDRRAKIFIRESTTNKQRQIKLYDVRTLQNDLLEQMGDLFNISIYYFLNHLSFEGCPVFALLLNK